MARRKKKLNTYQPWPGEAGPAYREVVRLHQLLTNDITTSINRGTRATPRNKFVLEALIDFILVDCQKLETASQEIIDLLKDERIGRFPKWYTLTEQIQDKVYEIGELARKVKPALMVNKLVYLVGVYDEMKLTTDKIEELLQTHPYRTGLEAWEEAADIVNAKLER